MLLISCLSAELEKPLILFNELVEFLVENGLLLTRRFPAAADE